MSNGIDFLAAAILVMTVASTASAAPLPGAPPAIAPQVVNRDAYPTRNVEFPGGVLGLPDLTYANYPGYRPLTLDLYLPPASTSAAARGVVVYVHGGGWRIGSTRYNGAFEDWPGVLASLAAKGYVVATVNYRLSGEAPFPAAVSDVKAAISWLRANATRFHIDKDKFVVWGASAGGQIAGLVADSCGVASLAPPAQEPGAALPESVCVQGGIGWFGAYDFTLMNAVKRPDAPVAAEQTYLGCKGPCPPETLRAASAVTYVDRGDPPMLLIHGDDDVTVLPNQSSAFYGVLKAAGVKADLLIIPGVRHNFIGPTADVTRAANLQALQRTVDFIDSVIGNEPHPGHAAPTPEEAAMIAQSDRLARAVGDHQRVYWFAPGGAVMPYRIFVPQRWDGRSRLPIILALHGAGYDQNGVFESAGDPLKQLAERHGYIIAAPLGYTTRGGYGSPFAPPPPPNGVKLPPLSDDPRVPALSEADVLAVLERTIAEYGADPTRVYVMGNSMGGGGAWYLGEKYAGRWGAIQPSDGPVSPDLYPYERLKGVHVLAIHGEKDAIAPIAATREMVARANKAGADVTFVAVKDGEHRTAWIMALPQIFDYFDAHPGDAR